MMRWCYFDAGRGMLIVTPHLSTRLFVTYYLSPMLNEANLHYNLGKEDTERLTDWGAIRLAQEAAETAKRHPTIAKLRLRHKTSLIAAIMRTVNVIVGEADNGDDMSEWQVRVLLGNLLGHLHVLTGHRTVSAQYRRALGVVHKFNQFTKRELFAELMAIIENRSIIDPNPI